MSKKDIQHENIIVMGVQGSGKSTQAKLIAQKLNIPYISTGDIFRRLSSNGTTAAKRLASYMNSGEMIPDDIVLSIVKKCVPKNGFVAEGFPRNLYQAKNLPFIVTKVIYIRLSDIEGKKRIALGKKKNVGGASRKGREDDTPEALERRLEIFHTQTQEVLNYYRNKGMLIEIDGDGTIEEVFDSICRKLL